LQEEDEGTQVAYPQQDRAMNELVQRVNQLLEQGEPANISVDEHSGYTGYKPQSIVDAMNEVFGLGGWGFSEIGSEIIGTEKGIAIAQVSVWLKDIEFKPTGWGQNRVTRGDIGDAKKGAQTDAIKKALSYFSIGARAYHGLLSVDKKQQRQPQASQKPQNDRTTNPTVNTTEAVSRPSGGQDGAVKSGWLTIYEQGKKAGIWPDVQSFYAKVAELFGEQSVNRAFLDGLDSIQLGWLRRETVEKAA
jgi:hypothetical protein